VTRSKSGGTIFQQLAFPAGGAPQSQQVGVGSDTNQTIYWLEVPRALHACRHTDATQCD
jgi:type IV pilus assembly protein PilY1